MHYCILEVSLAAVRLCTMNWHWLVMYREDRLLTHFIMLENIFCCLLYHEGQGTTKINSLNLNRDFFLSSQGRKLYKPAGVITSVHAIINESISSASEMSVYEEQRIFYLLHHGRDLKVIIELLWICYNTIFVYIFLLFPLFFNKNSFIPYLRN